jgi:hypothetical protein
MPRASFLFHQVVSSQKLGAEKTDHSDESRPEQIDYPTSIRWLACLSYDINKEKLGLSNVKCK